MQEQINKIEVKIDKIHEALCGNDYNKNGIISRVKSVEKHQEKDKKQKWMIAGVFVTLGAISKFGKEIVHFFTS
jgi:hypothetical protein